MTLKAHRVNRGLSTAELAEAAKVSRQSVWSWEAGKREPIPVIKEKLAEILGVKVEDIIF